jgi:hypothetical protein
MNVPLMDLDAVEAALLRPERLFAADEVCARPSPVPKAAGVYAWYFESAPAAVPTDGCHRVGCRTLLYVGISPTAPPAGGGTPSRQTVRSRIRYHFRGNAFGSTLRLTLGSLLADELGIGLRRVGSGIRMTFGHAGEARLTEWMAVNARVVWAVTAIPWLAEKGLIARLVVPLNLDQNRHNVFHAELSAARARQRMEARRLPVTS